MGDKLGLLGGGKVLVLTFDGIKFAFFVIGPENAGLLTMVNTKVLISPWISVCFFSSLACCSPLDVGDKPDFLEERKDAFLANCSNDLVFFLGFVKDGRLSFSGQMG